MKSSHSTYIKRGGIYLFGQRFAQCPGWPHLKQCPAPGRFPPPPPPPQVTIRISTPGFAAP